MASANGPDDRPRSSGAESLLRDRSSRCRTLRASFVQLFKVDATRYEFVLRQLLPHSRCISLSARSCGSGESRETWVPAGIELDLARWIQSTMDS